MESDLSLENVMVVGAPPLDDDRVNRVTSSTAGGRMRGASVHGSAAGPSKGVSLRRTSGER